MKTIHVHSLVAAALVGAAVITGGVTQVAAQSVGDKVSATADDVREKVQDAGKTAASKLEQLWQQIDEKRLKNRTRDEIVAWLIMGLLMGNLLSRVTDLKWVTAMVFGLVGAFLGGLVVHLTQFDMGLGPILIRYEDLLASLIGAVVLLLIARVVMRAKKTEA